MNNLLNSYEERVQAKREHYKKIALSAKAQSELLYQSASSVAEAIPLGQPILVGHYSEGSARRIKNQLFNQYRKAFDLGQKAEHYEKKAANYCTKGISSDDPAAIEKLKAELAKCEQNQIFMKNVNKIVRSKNKSNEIKISELADFGFDRTQAIRLLLKDSMGNTGFPSFELTNNNGNMSRIKERISKLAKLGKREDVEKEYDDFLYREDVKENRVMFFFGGKPNEFTRQLLKSRAFKWSPTRDAWVRQISTNAIAAGQDIIDELTN